MRSTGQDRGQRDGHDRGPLADFGMVFDNLYMVAYALATPVIVVVQALGLDQLLPSEFFPSLTADALHKSVLAYGYSIESTEITEFAKMVISPDTYSGAAVLWFPLAALFYALLFAVVGPVYDKVHNVVWNVVVEYLFHRKKAKQYERELERRKDEMVQINDKIYSLAQETNSLRDSVITDEMTKTHNKRFFLNQMVNVFEECRTNNEKLSLIMLDIDHFKKLNDGYGHVVGDEVLKEVAKVLRRFTPEQCWACRFGGEEFGIIVPRREFEDATEIARAFQEHVQALRFPHIDDKLRVTISQGICAVDFRFPESKKLSSYNDLLELSDQQLYRSKQNGRNRVSVIAVAKDKAEQD